MTKDNLNKIICAVNDRKPSECTEIGHVRAEIDNIDQVIITLLGKRFEYVREVVKYKERTAEGVVANGRREQVLRERRALAIENGLDPDVIEKMYADLVQYFIDEEMKIMNL